MTGKIWGYVDDMEKIHDQIGMVKYRLRNI